MGGRAEKQNKEALQRRLDASQPIAEQKSRRLRGQGGGRSLLNVPDFLNRGFTPTIGVRDIKSIQQGKLGNKTKLGGK